MGEKMFCVVDLVTSPTQVSLNVRDEEFAELTEMDGISVAPYVGRFKWIKLERTDVFSTKQWEHYIKQSYTLIKAKLPKKKQ
ncbi:MAG: MmcQ/YjbR family DNA-binding protein [Bacteroidia bacterium]